jgi:DNA-binding transcriptional regulator YiaG
MESKQYTEIIIILFPLAQWRKYALIVLMRVLARLRGRHKMPRALRELFILKAVSRIETQISDEPTPKEIEDYRRMAGLSISDAAKMLYVSQSAWSDWEAGHKTMHKGLLEYFILTEESKGKLYM